MPKGANIPETLSRLQPALDTLAPPEGWLHCGPAGAGHYAKMIHNGIEYEYRGDDVVAEMRKCLEYCKAALT